VKTKLDHRVRYLQIAFNYDLDLVQRVLPTLPRNPRILIEAGTPYIKREGMLSRRPKRWTSSFSTARSWK